MSRPIPPLALVEFGSLFEPSEELRAWVFATFIDDGGPLANPDHRHLADASIGFLWTNVENSRAMRVVAGQAEIMPPMAMGKWQRARAEFQIAEWFGDVPDFLITIDAPIAAGLDDASFCALIEHELYHCGQAVDRFGMPRFNKETGAPIFQIRGHDVEEFVGVVARYGAEAANVSEMVAAAKAGPIIGRASIAGVCGTCSLKVA